MFFKLVAVITIISAISGLMNVILASRRSRSPTSSTQDISEKRRRRKSLGSLVFWISSAALLFLILGDADPAAVLLGLAIALAIIFPIVMVKGGLRLVSEEDASRPIALAMDVATGEGLGSVVGQTKHGEKVTYKIRTKAGPIIERDADTLTIELQ